MAETQKTSESDEVMESFSVWLPRSAVEKLNRIALAKSTEKRLVTKAEVVRELVKKAKEQ